MHGTHRGFASVPLRVFLLLIAVVGLTAFSLRALAQEEAEPEEAPAAEEAEAGEGDGEDAGEADEEQKPIANPLGRIFGKIFSRPDGERILPEEAAPEDERVERDRARDNIDLRAPQKTEQTKRLRRAQQLIDEGNWPRAYEYLEAILGLRDSANYTPEDSLVRSDDDQWVSIRWEANRLLGSLPEDLQRDHEREHGPEAKSQLRAARESGDLARIAGVATRYFRTPAGAEAANSLANLYFERGEFGLAARWYERLLAADADITASAVWQIRAVHAFRNAGRVDRAEELSTRLEVEDVRVRVAGGVVGLQDWLKRESPMRFEQLVPRLTEWRQPYGTPQGLGSQVSADPVLIPRWDVTDAAVDDPSRKVGGQIDWLLRDLRDSGLPNLPSIQPIAIDDRIVFRTLGAVTVVDAKTGERLWETERGVSPLALLGAETIDGIENTRTHVTPYNGRSPDNHPLTNLLVRNGMWGTVTSDGSRIFVIEDEVVLERAQYRNHWRFGGVQPRVKTFGQYTLDKKSNRLTAYDLDSGRPSWSIGGPRSDEPFAPPLEGYRFFGPPVADGDELFAVGERDDEIRLVSIDPKTGGTNWSQLVALPDVDIDQDFARRTFAAQPAVSQGVVVCPTTVGWLVAVDRLNHNVLWARRYSNPPAPGTRPSHVDEMDATDFRSLGTRWWASPPIVVGNRVLFAPEEAAAIYCFDLFDGSKQWERMMNGHMYVAGVHGENVVLVGRDVIEAVRIENNETTWSIAVGSGPSVVRHDEHLHDHGEVDVAVQAVGPFGQPAFPQPESIRLTPPPTSGLTGPGIPSGRGVMIGDQYHLPMSNGALWAIDLRAGKIVSKSFLSTDARPLGNLVTYDEGLYSASAFGLTSFEPRPDFERTIAEAKVRPTASAAMKLAEVHFLAREYAEAHAALERVALADVPAELADDFRAALIRALVAVVREKPGESDEELAELASIVRTPAERLEYRRLQADQLLATDRPAEAFDAYLALAVDLPDTFIERSDADVRVQARNWLAGCLADTWERLSDEQRSQHGTEVARRAEKILDAEPRDLRRFCDLFAFHPATEAVEEAHLEKLVDTDAPLAVIEARARRLLASEDADRSARVRKTLDDLMATLDESVDDGPVDDWGEIDVSLVQTRDYSSNETTFPIAPHPARSAFLQRHRFVIHQQQNYFGGGNQVRRLEVVDARTGRRHWLPALRTKNNNSSDKGVALADGQYAFLAYQDVLNVLSPIDRRIVWTREMGSASQLSTFYRTANSNHAGEVTMYGGPQIVGNTGVASRASRSGLLAAANAKYVCLHGRRRITVHDAETGELRWSLDGLPARERVFGDGEFLYVGHGGQGTELRVFRATDGKLVETDDWAKMVERSLLLDENGLVVVENRSAGGLLGLAGVKTVVARHVHGEEKPVWSVEFERNTGLVRLDDDHLLGMTRKGGLSLLDLVTGETREFANVPEKMLERRGQVYAVADASRVYVFVSSGANRNRVNFIADDEIPHVRFNGQFVAFDRGTGELVWKDEIGGQALLLPYFSDSPFVVFASRQYVQQNNFSFWMAKAVIIDKKSGRRLYDDTVPSNNGFQSMHVDVARRFVELRAYNGRSIFHAVPRKTETGDGEKTNASTEPADNEPSVPTAPAEVGGADAAEPVPAPEPEVTEQELREVREKIKVIERAVEAVDQTQKEEEIIQKLDEIIEKIETDQR